MRTMIHTETKRKYQVEQHLITRNFWEYYVIKDPNNSDDIKFCYVMGIESEFGDVYIPEIKPYVLSQSKVTPTKEIMPPIGFMWIEDYKKWVESDDEPVIEKPMIIPQPIKGLPPVIKGATPIEPVFKFDQTRALKILNWAKKPQYGFERFLMSYKTLIKLVEAKDCIDLNERQNYSPSIREFIEWVQVVKVEPFTMFEAYLITDRDDARISIEGINIESGYCTKEQLDLFRLEFGHADEFGKTSGGLRAWWD